MIKKCFQDPMIKISFAIIMVIIMLGVFAPFVTKYNPNAQDIMNKFASYSFEHPLGTDYLGRCVYTRLVYGIRPTVFLSMFTMVCTIFIGVLIGVIAGVRKGFIDEVLMRLCDMMLSFPSQVMILAIVGVLGVGIQNVILANVLVKWAWYARMIRGVVISFRHKNFMLYSNTIGSSSFYKISRHLLPGILSELAILATLDMGWVILNISTLSFLGLGVQAPTPEWGAMLSEAKNVLQTNPSQMIAPGFAILITVAAFNLLGDGLRDAIGQKGESQGD
jgi:nickel transport system permease protein